VVRLLRFIDIQLRLPQLCAVLRHYLWERRMVPTKLFRAIRPGSPIGQDASAFPLLTRCGDATWLRQFAIASPDRNQANRSAASSPDT
jgi:hypothetical protein